MCTNVGSVIYMAVGNLLINSMGESVNTMALCIGRPPLTMGHCIGDLTLWSPLPSNNNILNANY